ncbi:MAG: LysR family transcriptional regulator [Gammaproteobacteria bacterium]|nr:LysR family transcriptional regulator [Gammaproteobacteria bacterium]
MDTHNLKAFLAVADTGSFSMGAERLFLTQPAISKRIAALESQLDTRLFDRIGRQIQLTPAGTILYEHAHRILQDMEDSRRAMANLDQHIKGSLKIATSHHIGLHRLPLILQRYNQQHPQVTLDIRFMDSEEACALIENGTLELAIITLPDINKPHLSLLPIWEDPLSIVIAPHHVLKTNATLLELSHYPAILPDKNTFTRRLIEQRLTKQRIDCQVSMETNYLETIKMLVSTGLGWSVLPNTMIDNSLRIISAGENIAVRRLGVATHQQRTLSNAANALLQEIKISVQ